MDEIIRLYLENFYPNGYDNQEEQKVRKLFIKIERLYNIKTIENSIKSNLGLHLGEIFTELDIKYEENILDSKENYIHNELRILPKPPRFINNKWEIDTEPIKQRKRYTITNLLNYFYKKGNFITNNLERDRNLAKYLIRTYGIDKTLYTIDAAWNINEDKDGNFPKDLIKLCNYVEDGEELFNIKRAEEKEFSH